MCLLEFFKAKTMLNFDSFIPAIEQTTQSLRPLTLQGKRLKLLKTEDNLLHQPKADSFNTQPKSTFNSEKFPSQA